MKADVGYLEYSVDNLYLQGLLVESKLALGNLPIRIVKITSELQIRSQLR